MNSKTEFVTNTNLLELDPATKPKGICLILGHANSFLALLGKPNNISNMMAFPPSAVYEQYKVSLRCFNAFLNEDHRKFEDRVEQQQRNSHEDTVANRGNVACTVVTNREHSPSLRLPDGSIFNGGVEAIESNKTSLISELKFNEVPELLSDYSKKVLQGKKCTHVAVLKIGNPGQMLLASVRPHNKKYILGLYWS